MRPLAPFAALLLIASSAPHAGQPADAPKRKPGLWQQKMTMSGPQGHAMSMSMCTDEKTDDLLAREGASQARCEQQSIRREGAGVVVEAVCRDGKTTIRTRGVFTGDFQSSYRGDLRSTFDPPMHGMKEVQQTVEARWVGPCKPGQKPGDVVVEGMPGMPGGMGSMNMQEMMKADPAKMQEMMRQMQQQMQSGKGAPAK